MDIEEDNVRQLCPEYLKPLFTRFDSENFKPSFSRCYLRDHVINLSSSTTRILA